MTGGEERGLLGWMVKDAVWHRTTYVSPHEYILRDEYPELFAAMKELVREEGYPDRFQGRTYRYADLGAHRYWLMGVVLNRALGGLGRP